MRAKRGEPKTYIEEALATRSEDCFLWPFALSGRGYPSMNGWRKVHRVVCEKVHGPPSSPAYEAAHSCGNRACINPRHLRWATRSENQLDRIKHGTGKRGKQHHNVRLTREQVLEIRASPVRGTELAALYNVSQQTICDIRKRRSWTWL